MDRIKLGGEGTKFARYSRNVHISSSLSDQRYRNCSDIYVFHLKTPVLVFQSYVSVNIVFSLAKRSI